MVGGGGGWVDGSIETKAISTSNKKLKLKLTEAVNKLSRVGLGGWLDQLRLRLPT